ncbi:SDR family oxidoreductase [Streptomyces sp. NPDC059629]|uniref:SDR family oxidoreductase n=1 Tax=Streptomyces sp. NPDC059629 TaxID=3346889 RepID=UPI0036959CCC
MDLSLREGVMDTARQRPRREDLDGHDLERAEIRLAHLLEVETGFLIPVLANSSSVILNASASAHGGYGRANAYAATKAAVSSLMQSWNADLLASHGIRFNAISPGPVDTPLYAKFGEQRAAMLEAISSGIPVKRMGLPGEIAEAVVYLASDASAFTVGQDLIVDGGQTAL